MEAKWAALVVPLMVLVAVGLSMVGWSVRPTPRTLLTAGLASGPLRSVIGVTASDARIAPD